jgi:hypothetical protein
MHCSWSGNKKTVWIAFEGGLIDYENLAWSGLVAAHMDGARKFLEGPQLNHYNGIISLNHTQ